MRFALGAFDYGKVYILPCLLLGPSSFCLEMSQSVDGWMDVSEEIEFRSRSPNRKIFVSTLYISVTVTPSIMPTICCLKSIRR
jgi:hypothetical protein